MTFKSTTTIIASVVGYLSGISVKKYAGNKPDNSTDSEYIVVNALPIDANVIQKCYVNVNYHIKDLGNGIPDLNKILTGSTAVIAALDKKTVSGNLIDFEGEELIRQDGQNEHYSNMRFSYKLVNY